MGIQDPYNRDELFKKYVLDRIRLTTRAHIPARYVMDNLKLETSVLPHLDAMIIEMESHVLGHRKGTRKTEESWVKDVIIPEQEVVTSWADGTILSPWPLLALLLLPSTALLGNLGDSIVCVVVATILTYFYAWKKWMPPDGIATIPAKTVHVHGRTTVSATFYDAFPEATVRFPPEMGRPVEIAVFNPSHTTVNRVEDHDG